MLYLYSLEAFSSIARNPRHLMQKSVIYNYRTRAIWCGVFYVVVFYFKYSEKIESEQ